MTALLAAGAADARQPRIDVKPSGLNGTRFSLEQHQYASRCVAGGTRIEVRAARGWLAAIGNQELRAGRRTKKVAARPGKRTRVRLARRGSERVRSYDVRCLPKDFPEYTFHRRRAGGPRWFSIQLGHGYTAIFDRAGVPVWWLQAGGEPDNAQVLPDGTFAFAPVDLAAAQTGDYEIRTLGGRLLRTVRGAPGSITDIHDIQLLPNGNYLIGSQVQYDADTTAFGGSAAAPVIGIEIQELTPEGRLVWHWDSRDHIGLAETGRWWDSHNLDDEPYDIVHWNALSARGHFVYLSFRHLDAVYKVDRRTGDIVWKLGGTPTADSLDVAGDPNAADPLGGQHDVRILPDGTITVHDNRTGMAADRPRAVHYRIDQHARRAKLIESFSDSRVPVSGCCGSVRMLDSGGWLVSWGSSPLIAGYGADGARLFDLRLAEGFSYRAIPVPRGAAGADDLRRGMDRIAKRSKAG
jgi:hypothetical protein